MEHFIRIAFWIFTPLFTLSGCKSTPIPEDFKFNILQTNVSCPNDTKLYSPTEVMPKCFTSALECVHNELFFTAKYECEDKDNRIGQAAEVLQGLIEDMRSETRSVPTTSNECACEKWAEVTFEVFLYNYKTLIQQIIAVKNS